MQCRQRITEIVILPASPPSLIRQKAKLRQIYHPLSQKQHKCPIYGTAGVKGLSSDFINIFEVVLFNEYRLETMFLPISPVCIMNI